MLAIASPAPVPSQSPRAAWIAVVLGYVWLVALAVLLIAFVTTNA